MEYIFLPLETKFSEHIVVIAYIIAINRKYQVVNQSFKML